MPGWLTFLLSYAAGLLGLWGGLALSVGNAFGGSPGGMGAVSLFAVPPLVALCVFALVFMLLKRAPLKLGFWAVAIALTAIVIGLTLTMAMQGFLTPFEGILIAVAVHFWASFFLMRNVW